MIVPMGYRNTFLGITKPEAQKIIDAFEKASFAPGHRGDWEMAGRKDSPDHARVNLYIYSQKGASK